MLAKLHLKLSLRDSVQIFKTWNYYTIKLASGVSTSASNILAVKRDVRGVYLLVDAFRNVTLATPKGWGEGKPLFIPSFSVELRGKAGTDQVEYHRQSIIRRIHEVLRKKGYYGEVDVDFTSHPSPSGGLILKSKPFSIDPFTPASQTKRSKRNYYRYNTLCQEVFLDGGENLWGTRDIQFAPEPLERGTAIHDRFYEELIRVARAARNPRLG